MAIYLSEQALEDRHDKQLQAVNEVYFGRTPGINALFNAYCDWREPLISNTKYFTAGSKAVYNKDLGKFVDLACKQFGFKSMSYNVVNISDINSFTITGVVPTRFKNMVEITREGYRFKDTANVSTMIFVFPDLIFSPHFTNEENFAIFLHETGHNFQTAASNAICSLSASSGLFTLITKILRGNFLSAGATIFISTEPAKEAFNNMMNKLITNESASTFYSSIGIITYISTYYVNILNDIANIATRPIRLIIGALYSMLPFMLELVTGAHAEGYLGERFADDFAAQYGFGEAQASCLAKFDSLNYARTAAVSDIIGAVPIVGHLYKLACLPGLFLWNILDVHPKTEDRCYSMLKDLKADLNDPNLPPATKTQLKKEIENYEKSMNDYFDACHNIGNTSVINNYIQEFVYKKLGGGVKFKISELPFMTMGGFRGEVNATARQISDTRIR